MVYIITHKVFNQPRELDEHYKVLHVGTNNDSEPTYLRDDTGESIAFKNKNYCELTGIYWIWKNGGEKESDIIGITHYRRFFTNRLGDFSYTYLGIKARVVPYNVIREKLQSYDIILPKRETIFRTVYQSYSDVHYSEDLELTRDAIKKSSPDYLQAYDKVMNGHYYYYANMMICKKKLFDEYASWLFGVLNELELTIDLDKYSDNYQKRVFGFLSERLLQVWVVHNKLKVFEMPVFNTEERRVNFFQKNMNRIKKMIGRKIGK